MTLLSRVILQYSTQIILYHSPECNESCNALFFYMQSETVCFFQTSESHGTDDNIYTLVSLNVQTVMCALLMLHYKCMCANVV